MEFNHQVGPNYYDLDYEGNNSDMNQVCEACARRFLRRDHIAKILKDAEKEWIEIIVNRDSFQAQNYPSVWHLMADRLTNIEQEEQE